MTATAPRFTDYAQSTVGRMKHTVSAERIATGWRLTLKAAPVQPILPSGDLPSAEFFAAIAAQTTAVTTREAPPQRVGDIEVRPAVAALALAQEILGTAWTVVDKGHGFLIELR